MECSGTYHSFQTNETTSVLHSLSASSKERMTCCGLDMNQAKSGAEFVLQRPGGPFCKQWSRFCCRESGGVSCFLLPALFFCPGNTKDGESLWWQQENNEQLCTCVSHQTLLSLQFSHQADAKNSCDWKEFAKKNICS